MLNRTETAMPQSHCFYATELALKAQAKATRIAGKRPAGARGMTRRLKVGVVGAGVGVNHIAAYRELGASSTRSRRSATSTPSARRKVAGEYGIPTVVTDFDALLKLDLDIVDICTPSALHFAQARKALLAGRHVVVEKPFASSLAEADALAELERKSGKRVSPDLPVPLRRTASRSFCICASEGLRRQDLAATVETHWRRLPAYYANPWRGRWATELGGCLTTHAIHNHDILTYVLGPIAASMRRTSTRVNPIETEDCAAAVLEMADGSFATLSVTLGAEEDMSRLRFCFEGLTVGEQPQPLQSRARRPGASSPPIRSASRRSMRRSRKSPPGRSATPASSCACTRR